MLKEVFSGESESTSTIDTMIHTRTDDKSLHAQDNIGDRNNNVQMCL